MDVTSYLLGKQAGGGSTPTLQDKSVTITENGTTNVTADEGYDGLSNVGITTNVSGGASDYFESTLSYAPSSNRNGLELLVKKLPSSITIGNSITSLDYFLSACIYIKETPTMNTGNITSMRSAFSNCWELETINQIDTSNVTNFSYFASGCTKLKNLPLLDLSSATNLNSMFEGTTSRNNFSDTSIDNLLRSCITTTSAYTGTKKLTTLDYEIASMSSTAQAFVARVQASQYYQDFLDAGWTIK